jgi:hypothetical protein
MTRIPLRNRKREIIEYAIIDDEDFERVTSVGRWYLQNRKDQCFPYVAHRSRNSRKGAVSFLLHRFILNLSPGDPYVDHIDTNPLNNIKSNLRLVTNAQNHQNKSPLRIRGTSKYRGVSWNSAQKKWEAACTLNYKKYRLGFFEDEDVAGAVCSEWRKNNMPFSFFDQNQ